MIGGLAYKFNSQALLDLISFFYKPRSGYMWTPNHGFQKAIALEYNLSKKYDINAELALTIKEAGIGLNKHIGKHWAVGLGVASEYLKWKPEVYASITREWTF